MGTVEFKEVGGIGLQSHIASRISLSPHTSLAQVQVRSIDPKTLAAVRASRRDGQSMSTLNVSGSSVNASSANAAREGGGGSPSGAQQPDHSFMSSRGICSA